MFIESYLPDGTRISTEYDEYGTRIGEPVEIVATQQVPAFVALNEGIVGTPGDGVATAVMSPVETLRMQGADIPLLDHEVANEAALAAESEALAAAEAQQIADAADAAAEEEETQAAEDAAAADAAEAAPTAKKKSS